MRRHSWGWFFAATLLTGAALAELPGAGNDAIALKRFEDGKAHYDAGEFELSLIDFQASMAIQPSPNSRLYVARCQRALGKVGSAFVSYRLAMREATDRLNATGEKRYKATRDAATSEMAEIEAKVPRLTVTVPSDVPPDFVVHVDGATLPKEAWGASVEVDPGKHEVDAAGPRRKPFSSTLTMGEGEQRTVAVVSERIPSGTLRIVLGARPTGLAIRIDDIPVDAAAAESAHEYDVGDHVVIVTAPGYVDFVWKGTVRDGDTLDLDVTPQVDTSRGDGGGGTPRWVPLALGGVGLVTLGFATAFAVQAKSLSDDEQAKEPLQRTLEERERVKAISTRANILFVTGGAFLVGAAVLSLTTRWRSDSDGDTHAHVVPWFADAGGGVAAWGSF